MADVEQIRNATWHSEHDDEQKHRIEESRPSRERRSELGQDSEKDRSQEADPELSRAPPIRMAMKNSTDRSNVKASGVM